jgi:hypothetical protein
MLGAAIALASIAAAMATPGRAQSNGWFQISANVLQAITITGSDLAFGTILPTSTTIIAPAAATAGRFTIAMQPNAQVTIGWSLPSALGPNLAVGGYQSRVGIFNSVALSVPFTPPSNSGTVTTSTATGNLFIWIGATLAATAAAPGFYTAPITLTVVYN